MEEGFPLGLILLQSELLLIPAAILFSQYVTVIAIWEELKLDVRKNKW